MQVVAILIAQFTQSYGMYGLLNWIPSFFTQTYGVDMSQLAFFTVVPYVAQAAVGVLSGYIADKMISKGKKNLQKFLFNPIKCMIFKIFLNN